MGTKSGVEWAERSGAEDRKNTPVPVSGCAATGNSKTRGGVVEDLELGGISLLLFNDG